MDTPIPSRMSTWDIPHVPPAAETPEAAPAAGEPQAGAVENNSPMEGPLGPLTRMEPGQPPSGAPTAQVRFLNAVVAGGGDLRITSGSRLLSSSLSPEGLSEYFTVPSGFRSFAFYDALCPCMLLCRTTLPLTAGDVVTLAVVRSGGGLDLVRVDDRPCGVRGSDFACIRCINLVYDSPGLDLVLTDGRVVFTDVRFKEVTNYRRAKPGRYDLYAAQTPYVLPPSMTDIETVEELPMVIENYFLPGFGAVEPLCSFFLNVQAGRQTSVYLMGDWRVNRELRVKTVENF